MERAQLSPKKMVGLPAVFLALSLALVLLPARPASAVSVVDGDCTFTVSGPFFYAGLVFPVIEVECDTVKQTITLAAALDQDGSEVATSGRTCRRTNKCVTGLASDGIFTHDVPGDQHWCGRGSAAVRVRRQPTQNFPELTSCETDTSF